VKRLWLSAAGLEDSLRPRRRSGAIARPLNFTVRRPRQHLRSR
jgi:hypothetical protein